MAYQCPACCGELKQNGSGFKCIYCGSAYASLAEIQPQSIHTQMQSESVLAMPQSHHGVDVFDTNINAVLEITWNGGTWINPRHP